VPAQLSKRKFGFFIGLYIVVDAAGGAVAAALRVSRPVSFAVLAVLLICGLPFLIGKSKGEWAGLIGAGDVVVSVNVVGGCGS